MSLWKRLVDKSSRVRLQIRVVLVVFRAEMARLDRWNSTAAHRKQFTQALQNRSYEVLDRARETLDGDAPEHGDLVRELDVARAEVAAA
jgi:hypothetical protein